MKMMFGKFKKRKKYFKGIKRFYFLIIVWLLFVVALIFFLLDSRLYEAQKKERLSKIKDFTDFVLIYEPQRRCEFRKRWDYKNITYYYDCIDHIFLKYGSIVVTLQEMIENDFLVIDEVINKMEKESTEGNITTYKMKSSSNQKGFLLVVGGTEEGNFDIIFKPLEINDGE